MTDRSNRIYMDYNASAPLRPEAREAMAEVAEALADHGVQVAELPSMSGFNAL